MTKTWILVANASEAKILTIDNLRTGELELVRELAHPESRKKISDLKSDRPGHYATDSGAHSAYGSKSDPKDVEAEHFAIQLVHELKAGWDQHKFKSLVIITPAHFHGLLKKHLHLLGALEVAHMSKDYTRYPLPKLHTSLKEHLFGG